MKYIPHLLFVLMFSARTFSAEGKELIFYAPDTCYTGDTINVPDSLADVLLSKSAQNQVLFSTDSVSHKKFKSKKIIAAVLSFPFPFGLLGLHRIFLGTKPYIPFVYIGTLGGCFLILPVIDFIAIVAAKEDAFKKFENNPKVFMWSH